MPDKKNPTPPTDHSDAAPPQATRPYRLTRDWSPRPGVTHTAGTRIDASADEVKARNIPAEPADDLDPRN